MLKLTLTLAAAATTVTACNTEEQLAADMLPGGSESHAGKNGVAEPRGGAPLTLLPQDAGDESPACLDGSPYGFYFQKSKTSSTKWTISIEGGGTMPSSVFAPLRRHRHRALRRSTATRTASLAALSFSVSCAYGSSPTANAHFRAQAGATTSRSATRAARWRSAARQNGPRPVAAAA